MPPLFVPYRSVRNPQNAALNSHQPLSVRSFEAHDNNTQKMHNGATGCHSLKIHPKRCGGFTKVQRKLTTSGDNSEFKQHLDEMSHRMNRLTNILNTNNPTSLYAPMYRFKYWVQDTLASKKITIGVLVVFIVLCLYVHYTPSASEKVIQLLKAIGIKIPQGVSKSVGGHIDLSNFGKLFSTHSDKFEKMVSTPVESIIQRVQAYKARKRASTQSRRKSEPSHLKRRSSK